VNLTDISRPYLGINKMKIDLTTGTWQDNPGCPINITLVSTSDVNNRIIVTMNGILDDALSGLLLLRKGINSNNDNSSTTPPSNDSNVTPTSDNSSATPTSSPPKKKRN
jgi:hypothetical protein